jgi:signal transduction histidine kinase/CheY-like chemotaxis protein
LTKGNIKRQTSNIKHPMVDHILSITIAELWTFLQAWWFKVASMITIIGGIFIYFSSRIRTLKDQKGELQRQVHERSELLEYSVEKEKKAREIIAQANRTKSLLLAKINHEIRTPLNGVLGMASLMAETSLTDEQREYNDTIRDCGDSLLKVVNDILLNDLLEYSKVESGKMELEQKDFGLENALEEVLDVFARKASQHGVELVYNVDADVPTQIIGDNLRLKQVLTNLVDNSIRFTRDGEILIKVYSRPPVSTSALELVFDVHDTGIGMDTEKVKKLSARLAGAENQINTEGVGLIICKKLVELMGGTLKLESQPGKGTLVSFSIRTAPSIQSIYANETSELTLTGEKKVLLIENNHSLATTLKELLRRWRLIPTTVNSGKQALEVLAQKTDISLVITDLRTADLDGIVLTHSIQEQNPGLPVILLAPAGDNSMKQYPDFFKAIVSKPVRRYVLNRQIRSCLGHTGTAMGENQKSAQKLSGNFSKQYPLRILVAEDNPTNQKLALKVLGKLGYMPDIAKHGKEVLEIVSHKNYDLILMDVQMPEMDGLEASRMIRLCLTTQPVIVAMTANTLQGDREECLKAGMDDYISKPMHLEELVHVLEKWASQVREKR